MGVFLEGPALPHAVSVKSIGHQFLEVDEPVAAPPCDVDLVVRQGTREQRKKIRLPNGLSADTCQAAFDLVGG